jgi:energy-coupling factor transporter ATP-binding protein EcfA2
LGEFDHSIEFPLEWNFVIIHGPNGVGKTKLLELMRATLALELTKVASIPFREFAIQFSDRSLISVESRPAEPDSAPSGTTLDIPYTQLRFKLRQPNSAAVAWECLVPIWQLDPRVDRIMREEAYMRRLDEDHFEDTRDGEIIDHHELVRRYVGGSSAARRRLLTGISAKSNLAEVPEQIKEFTQAITVRLIETQRLVVRDGEYQDRSSSATVASYSQDVAERLQATLAQNSKVSQELDKTFAGRVISKSGVKLPRDVTDEVIRQRYNELSKLRIRIAEIALLDPQDEVLLPRRALETWERRFLWTYLEDTEKKLDSFDELLERITLFKEIIRARFVGKTMTIDPRGMRFHTRSGHELAPTSLSSGEQHELVLFYDLLFRAQPSTLVLIDEPEISLHVTWQQQFLSDLNRIAGVSSLRFIVATHSPQIIHTWLNQAVGIGAEGML